MGRRSYAWALAAVLWMSMPFRGTGQQSVARPPNLVVITIDTLRPDHLECYGYKSIKTPRIDGLAADGVLIEKAYTPIPLTLPSHASILTGTYPLFHGVRDFTGFTLSKDRKTLATMLRATGYSTGAVVGSAVLESRWGLNQGFDFYYDNFSYSATQNWQPIAERTGDIVVREALAWLDKNKGKPFFLWAHLFDPHDPYKPPPPYDRQYAAHPYDGEIAFTDEMVGRVLDYLKQNNLYDRSLIVLVGDHGEGLGEHGEKYHGFFIYDSTLRVPLIFKLPGAVGLRGRRLAGPLRTIDIVPTVLQVLDLTGKVRATEVQGRGAYSSLMGKSSLADLVAQAEIFLPFYHFEWSPLVSLRRGRYKFIDAPRPELYDTVSDPGEMRNLYPEKTAIAAQLKELLRQDVARYAPREGVSEVPRDVDPATVEKLASLGYLALSRGASGPPLDRRLPDPKDRIVVYELIREGTLAAQREDLDRAVRILTEAVRREPGSLVAHFQLGNVYRVAGSLDKAEEEFQRTLELRPDYALALRRLGEIYLARRRYDEAEAAYKKVVAQSPDDLLAWFNLGGMYVLEDRWDDAVAAFRKARDLRPGDARVQIVLARALLKTGDLDGALQAAQAAAKLAPKMVEAHEAAMEVYLRQGRAADVEREAGILERLRAGP